MTSTQRTDVVDLTISTTTSTNTTTQERRQEASERVCSGQGISMKHLTKIALATDIVKEPCSTQPFTLHALVLPVPSSKLLTASNTRPCDYLLRLMCVVEWVLCNMRDTERLSSKHDVKPLDRMSFTCEWHHYPDLYLGSRCNTVSRCKLGIVQDNPRLSIEWQNEHYGVTYNAEVDVNIVSKFRRTDVTLGGRRQLHFTHLSESYSITLPVVRSTRSLVGSTSSVKYAGDVTVECVERNTKAIVSLQGSNQVLGFLFDNTHGEKPAMQVQGLLTSCLTFKCMSESNLPFRELQVNLTEDLDYFPPILIPNIQSMV